MSTSPDRWHEAMAAQLCGELSETAGERLEQHLDTSPEEREQFVQLTETLAVLDTLALPAAPEGMAERVLDRLAPASATPAPAGPAAAEVALVHGQARRSAGRGAPWETVKTGDTLAQGDAFELGRGARALLRLPDTSELWINAETVLHFGQRAAKAFISLVRGEVLALVAKQRQALPIITPAGTVRVLGTAFDTDVDRDGVTKVAVLEGEVEFSNKAGRTKVGVSHRIEARRGGKPPRPTRIGGAELERLSTWSRPLRAASTSAHRLSLRGNGKDNRGMGHWKLLAGIVAVGALGVLGYSYFMTPERTLDLSDAIVEETFTPAAPAETTDTEDAAAAQPDDLITFTLDQSPGLAWTNTVRMDNDMNIFVPNAPPQAMLQRMTMVMDSRVASHTPEGHARVESTFRDLDMTMTVNGEEMNLDEMLAQRGGENPLDALLGATFTQIMDSRGNILESEGEFPSDSGLSQMAGGFGGGDHDFMRRMMESVASGVPPEPVQPGAQWTREVRLPGAEGIVANCTSTFDRLETINDQRVAFVRREVTLTSFGGMPPTEMEMAGARIETTFNRLQFAMNIEQAFLIDAGRWVEDRGTMTMNMGILTRVQPPQGPPQETSVVVEGEIDFTSEYDYQS